MRREYDREVEGKFSCIGFGFWPLFLENSPGLLLRIRTITNLTYEYIKRGNGNLVA